MPERPTLLLLLLLLLLPGLPTPLGVLTLSPTHAGDAVLPLPEPLPRPWVQGAAVDRPARRARAAAGSALRA